MNILLIFLINMGVCCMEEPDRVHPRKRYIQWWNQETILQHLDLEKDVVESLQAVLQRYQVDYWTIQTAIRQQKGLIKKKFLEKQNSSKSIEKDWREKLRPELRKMENLKLEAYLYVRDILSEKQLKSLLDAHPKFFELQWFKTAKMSVFMGNVEKK
ncbi:MAG: hypothetical protein CSA81_07870 [Acidobacteria bacterium]|nr:MAG: hypothetical protein CSA81_07870 [Acidobacteriota bacterium]